MLEVTEVNDVALFGERKVSVSDMGMAGKERLDSWHCRHVFPPTNSLAVKLQLIVFFFGQKNFN